MAYTPEEQAKFAALYKGSLIPLHACLVGLTWIVHDYLITLEDEIRYVWPQKRSFSKIIFLWIRYYSIALLIFDVTQIHVFSIPGITSDNLCVAMDSIIRVVGAISLWSVEIVLQLRIYALYNTSRTVAAINGILFLGSIAGFFWVLVFNAQRRHAVIADAIHLPLPGCPSLHSGIEWVQWVPATAFEGVLFMFALAKTSMSTAHRVRRKKKVSLLELLIRDNVLYFLGISILLVFNNLMVVGITKIPWFSYSPFHAAIGVLTTRMMLNLRKAAAVEYIVGTDDPPARTPQGRPSMPWRVAPRAMDSDFSGTTAEDSSFARTTDVTFARADSAFSRDSTTLAKSGDYTLPPMSFGRSDETMDMDVSVWEDEKKSGGRVL
ncbi:hypothetical protein CYLTODRAFT_421165 [Cylindrobasidium torrendii FP15055 ss-10]|uniref:DUF6533 domain-containing protein n=1 Tax=Cylindrobasidium torrendii FP15055 ss-10 TaxID=1314674 RepID=A0A0D7BEK6_9AGAR|nr:hypothetical protein CYLTODRAFT_421165 [Cylindrobasidium torrendii FP15055 ss-10]